MPNCKPGELAWIKRSAYAPCIGWLVEVVRSADTHAAHQALFGTCWLIRHREAIEGSTVSIIPDSYLTPHRPGPLPEAEHTDTDAPAAVEV